MELMLFLINIVVSISGAAPPTSHFLPFLFSLCPLYILFHLDPDFTLHPFSRLSCLLPTFSVFIIESMSFFFGVSCVLSVSSIVLSSLLSPCPHPFRETPS